ncbi:SpoIIE family protein phosphatase [Thermospira aquatica]|uniref:SpoIIE family protein phosphatase n=1 Tax=Thermospira aquatica TaxID=2828656 RepID=A0AAX3BDK0_9SPIR|nr:SpoIIE family protein phosphatase [Thermospira aquatica]URA10286.1 SpoIIE family protein phosphatase [Thermospira aquatica]
MNLYRREVVLPQPGENRQEILDFLQRVLGFVSYELLVASQQSIVDIKRSTTLPFSSFSSFLGEINSSGVDHVVQIYDVGPLDSLVSPLYSPKKHVLWVYVFPLYPFDVKYFLILVMPKSMVKKKQISLASFLIRQFFLNLYLEEETKRYKESQEFLFSVFNKNPVGLVITGSDGVIRKYNREFFDLAGEVRRIQFVIGEDLFDVLVRHQNLDVLKMYKELYLHIKGIPLYEDTGSIRGYIFSIVNETKNYLLSQKISQSEEQFKQLFQQLPVGLVIFEPSGKIYLANEAFLFLIGMYNDVELYQKHISDILNVTDTDFRNILQQVQKNPLLYFRVGLRPQYGNRVFSVHIRPLLLGEKEVFQATLEDVSLENELYRQLDEKSKRVEEELMTAKRVWEHILTVPTIYNSRIRFEVFSKPSSHLGGDFYDLFALDDTHIGVVVADVSGHGVSAALITSMLKIYFEFNPKDPHKISDVLRYLHYILSKVLPPDQFVTLFYGVIDTKTSTISYINCGNPKPLFFSPTTKSVSSLEGMAPPLGSIHSVVFSDYIHSQKLSDNTRLLFYTDGLFVFRNEGGFFNHEKLADLFARHAERQISRVLPEMYDTLLRSYFPLTEDDATMVMVVLEPPFRTKQYLSLPSNVLEIDHAIVKIQANILSVADLNDDEKWRLYTALYEALINAVEHGNRFDVQKRVHVFYRVLKQAIVIKVRDEGKGFVVEDVPNPLDKQNLLKPSGRGIFMMRKLMTRVKYNRTGNEVVMLLRFEKPVCEEKV